MRCYNCRTQLPDDVIICPKCGESQGFSQELIDAAIRGEEEAYTELYRKTQASTYVTVKALISDEDTALDIVQDSYIKAFKNLAQLQDHDKFRPWIKRIAHNRAVDYLRAAKPVLFSSIVPDDSDEAIQIEDTRPENIPDIAIDRQETARLISEILDSLPTDQRAVVTMFYYEQLSVGEIAQLLGLSEGTVKSRLNYGRKKVEVKVRDLEKKGTKLYALTPVAFLLLLLRNQEAQAAALPDSVLRNILSGTANNGAGAGVSAEAEKLSGGDAGQQAGGAFSDLQEHKPTPGFDASDAPTAAVHSASAEAIGAAGASGGISLKVVTAVILAGAVSIGGFIGLRHLSGHDEGGTAPSTESTGFADTDARDTESPLSVEPDESEETAASSAAESTDSIAAEMASASEAAESISEPTASETAVESESLSAPEDAAATLSEQERAGMLSAYASYLSENEDSLRGMASEFALYNEEYMGRSLALYDINGDGTDEFFCFKTDSSYSAVLEILTYADGQAETLSYAFDSDTNTAYYDDPEYHYANAGGPLYLVWGNHGTQSVYIYDSNGGDESGYVTIKQYQMNGTSLDNVYTLDIAEDYLNDTAAYTENGTALSEAEGSAALSALYDTIESVLLHNAQDGYSWEPWNRLVLSDLLGMNYDEMAAYLSEGTAVSEESASETVTGDALSASAPAMPEELIGVKLVHWFDARSGEFITFEADGSCTYYSSGVSGYAGDGEYDSFHISVDHVENMSQYSYSLRITSVEPLEAYSFSIADDSETVREPDMSACPFADTKYITLHLPEHEGNPYHINMVPYHIYEE